MVPNKPLFVFLKTEFYEAFRTGTKSRGPQGFMEEYRLRRGQWNARVCWLGRQVVLSKGYGKGHRMRAVIRGYREGMFLRKLAPFVERYGPAEKTGAAGLALELELIPCSEVGYDSFLTPGQTLAPAR